MEGDDDSVTNLRNTGSKVSFLSRKALPTGSEPQYTGEKVTVSRVNSLKGTYPLCHVHIESSLYAGPITSATDDHSPLPGIDLLLGDVLEALASDLEILFLVAITRSMVKISGDTRIFQFADAEGCLDGWMDDPSCTTDSPNLLDPDTDQTVDQTSI